MRNWIWTHAEENPGHRTKADSKDPGSCKDCDEKAPAWRPVTKKEEEEK